jgi:hypothetical protein
VDEGLTDSERRALAELWAFRARSEHEATSRFARLSERLRAVGAAPAIVDLATTAVEDERRHRGACAAMAERYGEPVMAFAELVVPEVAPPELALPERVLYETVAFCAITESINAALLARTQKVATDPETHRVVRDILSDEVNHSRVGWGHLASTTVPRAFLGRWLPFMLGATLPETLFDATVDDVASDAALRHGLLPRSVLQEIFRDTMSGVVLPGLENFGVDTSAAKEWLAAHAR